MTELLSITQAVERGIDRVRLPMWANQMDHIKIDIIEGKPGPWLSLYAPFNLECNGEDPVKFLWATGRLKIDINSVEFVPYTGPLPNTEEYKKAVAGFSSGISQ